MLRVADPQQDETCEGVALSESVLRSLSVSISACSIGLNAKRRPTIRQFRFVLVVVLLDCTQTGKVKPKERGESVRLFLLHESSRASYGRIHAKSGVAAAGNVGVQPQRPGLRREAKRHAALANHICGIPSEMKNLKAVSPRIALPPHSKVFRAAGLRAVRSA